MKLFLITTIVAPSVDFCLNGGHYINLAMAYVAHAGHTIANAGATLMPSIAG